MTRLSPTPAPPAAPSPAGWRAWWWVSVGTALVYALAGKFALLLAIPPGYASPLYPSAGLALAAVLVHGRRALPGVLVGALVVNASLADVRQAGGGLALWLPLVPAAGATAQAALGAWWVGRRVAQPLRLSEPRDVARFFVFGALLACLVNASLSSVALALAGVVPVDALAQTWWTWWAGDALGVLIATPVALTLIGRPAADWRPRRNTVALPLLATTALLAVATTMVARWDQQRSQGVFERDAQAATAALRFQVHDALQALEAMRGLFIGSDEVTLDEFALASRPWLQNSASLQALGYSQRVPRPQLAAYQAQVAMTDGRRYQVFDRTLPGQAAPASDDSDVVAMRYIEPAAGNDSALGVNALSVPAARQAILRSVAQDMPAASSGFWLTQSTEDETGVVIYRALYQGSVDPPPPPARAQAFQGVVFATLRMQHLMDQAMRDTPPYLAWCLVDLDPQALRRRLAGPAGCDAAAAPAQTLVRRQAFDVAGQRWRLSLTAPLAAVPDPGGGNAWLFSSTGLASAAALAALLLTVTGRTRRIETAVAERTADLQHEMAERARTESALRETEQRFRNIFDHAPVGMALADLTGRVTEANPRLWEMLGHVPPWAGGPLPAPQALPLAEDPQAMAQALPALLARPDSELRLRTALPHADGSRLWAQVTWSVLRDAQGQPQGLVAVAEDITEHLQLQQAEQARRLAEASNQAKNEFLSRMSHELRTPLNAMLGFAQLLEMDRQPAIAPHQQAWTHQVLQAGWHLLEMINDTLDLARIDAGQLRVQAQTVALAPMVAHCVAMVQAQADQRQIQITVDLASDAQQAWCDATRGRQVLTNLLSNAVKYNQPGGRVRVSSQRLDGQRLCLRVTDTGLGLSPAQLAELFQPFNRLGREQGDSEGTGIGLVISRRLAELMGGSLQAESSPGHGASFVLQLPAADPEAAAADGAAPDTPASPQARPRQVHYIEDNETNVEVMRGILSHRPLLELTVSSTGQQGLDALRQQRPDLLLLDMHLPDTDGLALLQQLKADPATTDLPVLVVSADATPQRVAQALAAGAHQYLTKPVNLEDFLRLIDQLLAEPAPPGPAADQGPAAVAPGR